MSGKKSIRDFFKPKTPKVDAKVSAENIENGAEIENVEMKDVVDIDISPEPIDVDTPPPTPSQSQGNSPPGKCEAEAKHDPSPPPPDGRRRSLRSCANRAREALMSNGRDYESSSSSDEEDFIRVRSRSSRKRGRPSKSGKGDKMQATLSKNGKIVRAKDKDLTPENNTKKKVKLDPETQAFLRSGVPDVIKRARAKALDKDNECEVVHEVVAEKPQERRKVFDAETIAFLHSGIPDVVIKVRQSVDKRKEKEDALAGLGFFPRTSHVCKVVEEGENENVIEGAGAFPFGLNDEASEEPDIPLYLFDVPSSSSSLSSSCLKSYTGAFNSPLGLCCDPNSVTLLSPEVNRPSSRTCDSESSNNQKNSSNLPWIDAMKVTSPKKLVVDKTGLETLTRWLKQWRNDIKDDGGTSRKADVKRKRGNNSESDFITSDEEDSDMKKKSVLLTGPTGCGKTAAVYVLSKHYGFEVVEVNFSSKRPGKEVLQRVEEAVLSHQLKTAKNCLLLFKDIDLVDSEEDEGFFSAVAQLITTAVRPIVMTSSLPGYWLLDSKLDKKDPLRIPFSLPKPEDIVSLILKPILSSTKKEMIAKNDNVNVIKVDKWLDSLVRHSGCDIRQCINQLQVLLSTSKESTCLSNKVIHLYSSPFQRHLIDLNFPRQSIKANSSGDINANDNDNDNDNEEDLNLTKKARSKRAISHLKSLSDNLSLFSELDWISRPSPSYPTRIRNTFGDIDEDIWRWNHLSGMKSPFFTRLSMQMKETDSGLISSLVLESDGEIDKWIKIDELNEEIGQYLDISVMATGNSWENCAAVRTIVKNNLLDSAVGRNQKRHGRMASYFNRLDRTLRDKISNTLGFQEQFNSIKL